MDAEEAKKAHEEWLQRRNQWTAQQQQQQQGTQQQQQAARRHHDSRQPPMLTYDMLDSYKPFPQPVPLSLVVEALNEMWEEDYDM